MEAYWPWSWQLATLAGHQLAICSSITREQQHQILKDTSNAILYLDRLQRLSAASNSKLDLVRVMKPRTSSRKKRSVELTTHSDCESGIMQTAFPKQLLLDVRNVLKRLNS